MPTVRGFTAALLVAVAACQGAKPAVEGGREVRVAAAADLKFAFEDVKAAFQERHPGIAVKVTYGSSGNFFSQLSNEAPFDVFLSADIDYPRKLVEMGRGVNDSEFVYAIGRIVVWVPKDSSLDVGKQGMKAVMDPSVQKVAIANPKHAPYGRAAEAALKHYGVYEGVKDRLVFGDNIAQAAQFAESGAADVGVIAHSLAVAPPLKNCGRFWEVPAEAHSRIEQCGVILTWAKDPEAARALRTFITGDEGGAIFQTHGFHLPGE